MSSFQRNVRLDGRLVVLALAGVLLTCFNGPVVAVHIPQPGVIVVNTVISDNGDDDGFADSNETVEMRLTVRNVTGSDLNHVIALLSTVDPKIECITAPRIEIGSLGAGEIRLVEAPFVFKVADVDRSSTTGTYDFEVAFDLTIATGERSDLAIYPTLTIDLDLDRSGGSEPTTFFEGFEGGDFGAFTSMALDTLYGGPSDVVWGHHCQYTNPAWPGANNYGILSIAQCNVAGGDWSWRAFSWQVSQDRAFSGTASLYFGVPLSPPLGFTTPLDQIEAVRTSDPIHLGWGRVCSSTRSQSCAINNECPAGETCEPASPQLVLKHQISLVDSRTINISAGESADRGVVHVQRGGVFGRWLKIEPFVNSYDQRGTDDFSQYCMFDPHDDGNNEDSFFDPLDPNRRLGPSSTCFPALTFVHLGDTDDPFDPNNIGNAGDGPGVQGALGAGTWVESRFGLSRFRGQSIRLRFLATTLKSVGPAETWDDWFVENPHPGDDGWWIDDVQVTDTLVIPATTTIDDADNSQLPGLGDQDLDGLSCDNCSMVANPGQFDSDGDLVGDACDACPLEFVNDQDGDGLCCPDDNCCTIANTSQLDLDGDAVGDVCDNCPTEVNAGQEDRDFDGLGDSCDACPDDPNNNIDSDAQCGDVDNCPFTANTDQSDVDSDSFGDACDNCPAAPNNQADLDSDSLGDACDNCPADYNPSQIDRNLDGEGDHCDLNDNLIYITFSNADTVDWQEEVPFVLWNSYRGDLAVLKSTGVYTQAVGSNVLAAQVCGLTIPFVQDLLIPAPGSTAFYLTTGVTSTGSERPLGQDSSGTQRPNSNPCP